MTKLLVVLAAVGIALCLAAPAAAGRLESSDGADSIQTFSKYRLLLHSGRPAKGTHGRLGPEYLEGVGPSGEAVRIPRADIHMLDVSSGTKAGSGFAIGAGLGLVTALLAIVQVQADETRELDDSKVVPVTLGFVAGGGLIGLAVGSSSASWNRVDLASPTGRTEPAQVSLLCCRIAF